MSRHVTAARIGYVLPCGKYITFLWDDDTSIVECYVMDGLPSGEDYYTLPGAKIRTRQYWAQAEIDSLRQRAEKGEEALKALLLSPPEMVDANGNLRCWYCYGHVPIGRQRIKHKDTCPVVKGRAALERQP